MTLVYDRQVKKNGPVLPPGPRTHAFILGCGRFPALGDAAKRQSTVAGAREVIKFLLNHQDELVAPLGTIECLLSDPDAQPGADTLGIGVFDGDCRPPGNDAVDSVISKTVQPAGDLWLPRCNAGDHMFFYMSSHGVADQNITASGLFEDVLSNRYRKWGASINVNRLCQNLPVTEAAACWVFLDACQELIPNLLGNDSGLAGTSIVDATPTEIANAKVRSVGIAGSLFGQKAWAPDGPAPPYFTQALLEGFAACIDQRADGQWVVTGPRLLFGLTTVASAAFGYDALAVTPLSAFATSPELVTVTDPKVPVVFRTKDLADMAFLQHVEVSDGRSPPLQAPRTLTNCFLKVPANGQPYVATGVFNPPQAYQPSSFRASPCGQVVVLSL